MGKGYEKIILIGVSAGGLGSILYSMKHENQIDAIVAISPYLGDEEILEEIKNQGGVRNWKVDKKPDEEEEWQRAMWYWIKENYSKENEKAPILFVGSGREDYVMEGVRLLIPLIPEERTVFVKGKHEWEPWREILGKIIEKKTFRKILASKKTAEGD
jgi:pimeloyl-ACP methyl ester carboxylesterase